MEDGRDDAGGAVGGSGNDATARGVLLVHGQGEEVHPVHDRERIAGRGLLALDQPAVHLRGPALHTEAGEDAGGGDPAPDAFLHDAPDPQQAGADVRLGADRLLVGEHDVADREVVLRADLQERRRRLEGMGQPAPIFFNSGAAARGLLVHDESAADRVVDARSQRSALRVERGEPHAVRVVGEALPEEAEVLLRSKRDLVLVKHL